MEKKETFPLVLKNVTITLPDAYRADLAAAVLDMQSRFPDHDLDHLLSWAVRFYLDRFPKMQQELTEVWVKPSQYESVQNALEEEYDEEYHETCMEVEIEMLMDEP